LERRHIYMSTPKLSYKERIQSLFESGRSKRFPRNQLIYYQGDPLTHVHLIKSGYIKAYTILDSGDTRTILLLGPGDIFPIAFSLGTDWKNYDVKYFYQTMTDAEITSLSAESFKDAVESNPRHLNTYLGYIARSNQAIIHQLEVMKDKQAINKIAHLLPYLVLKLGERLKPNFYQLRIKISHQEVADLSGVTRETTTTLIKKLEKTGRIKQKKGRWIIKTSDEDEQLLEADRVSENSKEMG